MGKGWSGASTRPLLSLGRHGGPTLRSLPLSTDFLGPLSVSPVSLPLPSLHVFLTLSPRYLVEEIKKREGFELVMEVGLLAPLNASPTAHLALYVKPHKGPGAKTGKQPLPSPTYASLIPPLSPSSSTCASGLCLPACGGRRRAQITARGCLR